MPQRMPKTFPPFRFGWSRKILCSCLDFPEIRLLGGAIVSAPAFDFFLRPARSPFDAVLSNVVMGLAWKAPVANGRLQRNRLAVKNKRPVGGPDGCHNLVSASADTEMRGCGEAYRNVNRPLLYFIGNKLDEFMLEDDFWCHCGRSSLRSKLVSILN